MTGFIVRRLLSSVLVVILTSMFVFVLFFKGLGDSPAVNACAKLHNGHCPPAALKSIKHQMGFDKSVVSNYGTWAKGNALTVCAFVKEANILPFVPMPADGWIFSKTQLSIEQETAPTGTKGAEPSHPLPSDVKWPSACVS